KLEVIFRAFPDFLLLRRLDDHFRYFLGMRKHRDVEIFYRETHPKDVASPSPPILFLHGFPSTSHQYRGLMDRLGGSFRMIAPDYPGFGQSTAPLSKTDGGTF
ncbi:alpha/beta fold hydrolase, partial [Rhizobium leguminosarum]|uniref:alpha/beta fold hydrolase n=1 Tax=Rhizobium leguminosarum TaxID=384 RepID=UPI003F9B774C